MTLRHLRIFKAIAETGNFTKAAQLLNVTQSAVSHTMHELEDEAGTALFDRLSKGVQLTQSGRLLLEEVTPILSACDNLESHIGSLERTAPIRIVSSITIATFKLPQLLRQFNAIWPDIQVEVEVVSAANAVEILKSGKADIALIEGVAPQGPFNCRKFDSYNLQAVCAPDYPIATTRLEPAALCSEKLLLREPGSAIRTVLDSELFLAGCTAHPTWCSVNSFALIEAAKAGLGITILPEALLERDIQQHFLIPLELKGLSLKNDMLAVWHKDKYFGEPLQTFLELIIQKC